LIERAIKGVDTVYHVCPGIQPREREIGFAWIDAAHVAGVRHFVFSSVLHAILSELVQHRIKRQIEEHLLSSHLEFTILQPTIYMAPRRFERIFETGILRAGWSLERHQSLIDIGDITDVAATVLTDGESHFGATYELAAPGRYTAHDMAAIIAELLGKTVTVERIGAEAYLQGLFPDRDPGTMPFEVSVSQSLSARYSSNDFIGNPNVLTWLLGRQPRRFEEFVASYGSKPA
ncbi:SDR family oxidoreductase, partial [Sphingomonas sp.]|uniref:SDR family oxidoreductase n=1 Tax=Sphingomonas sp. TaxID=28214 RepID=UPI0025DF0568